jgi:hypothetical protein
MTTLAMPVVSRFNAEFEIRAFSSLYVIKKVFWE